jgi:hypothetical protein
MITSDKMEINKNKKFKVIIYGDPGIGKTVLLGGVVDVPEMMPALMIDFEGNLDSIESKCEYVEFNGKELPTPIEGKITCIRVETYEDFDVLYNVVLKYDAAGEFPYKTLFIDSLSALDFGCIESIVSTINHRRVVKGVPSLEDFKVNNRWLTKVFWNLSKVDAHIFATCHVYDGDDNDPTFRPKLTGGLRQAISGIFKQTLYMSQRNGTRILRFQPRGNQFAKDCSENSKFGEEMSNPTMTKLFDTRYRS